MIKKRTQTLSFFRLLFPWLMVACGVMFYCYNFILRVSPSMMKPELTQAFHISATEFGTLAGFYYWAYTPMQIPAGLLYDRFGARYIMSVACLVSALGLAMFIATNDYLITGCGRFLIGLGCAFAYMGTLKLAAIWLPANRFATVACSATAFGMGAGALSQHYLTNTVSIQGYQHALLPAVFFGLSLALFLTFFLRSRDQSQAAQPLPTSSNPKDINELLHALKCILTNKQVWIIGLISCLSYLPASVFLDLWGISYLKQVYGLAETQAVAISSYTFAGWIIAGPIIGILSDKIRLRRLPLVISAVVAATLLCIVFYVLPGRDVSLTLLNTIFFTIGFSCGSHPLCFALGKENNPIQFSATSVAVTNMLTMASGAIFQPVVGKLLDYHASGATNGAGLLIYNASDYSFALSVVPLGVVGAIILAFFLKETHCQTIYAIDETLGDLEPQPQGALEEA